METISEQVSLGPPRADARITVDRMTYLPGVWKLGWCPLICCREGMRLELWLWVMPDLQNTQVDSLAS